MRFFALIAFCFPFIAFTQISKEEEYKIEEYKTIIGSSSHDSIRIQAILGWDNLIYHFDPSLDSSLLARVISISEKNLTKNLSSQEESFFIKELAEGQNYLGTTLTSMGFYEEAIQLHLKSIPNYRKAGLKHGLDGCTINLGNAYYDNGNLQEAIIQLNNGIKITYETQNLQFRANALVSLGNIYLNLEQIDKSLSSFHKANKLATGLDADESLETIYLNMGNAYLTKGDLDSTLICYDQARFYAVKLQDEKTLGTVFNNLGEVYLQLELMDSSFFYYNKGMALREKLNYESDLVYSYAGLASWYTKKKEKQKSIEWGEKALNLAQSFKTYVHILPAASSLYEAYMLSGEYEKGLKTYIIKEQAMDSIQSKANQKELINQEIKYQYEKNRIVDSLAFVAQKEIDDLARAKDKEKEQHEKFLLYGGLIFALLLVALAYFGYRRKIKDNKIISEQKEIAESQKEQIKEAHKEITDSINYAERIQRSFLATKQILDMNLKDYFVFFQPKDVVSGDFYWAGNLANGDFALVNADSTGHGVPGAIMSILNIASIEKAVEQKVSSPAEIFNLTRQNIINQLKKDGSIDGGKDGMDAVILCFNKEKSRLTYTAAQNPIWIIRQEKLIEIKPEKMPVGKHDLDSIPFAGGEFELQAGDQIYSITDGYQDQFGGPKGKKFMVKKFRKYVLSISHLTMSEQHIKIKETFTNWKGQMEQIDDVCVIGIKI